MKLKSIKKKIWSIVIIITTLIGILPVQANTTETPVKDVNPEKPDVPLNKNDAFQKVQKRRVQEKR